MNIEGVDRQRGLSLSETIKIDICNNETGWTTIGILENSLKVVLN